MQRTDASGACPDTLPSAGQSATTRISTTRINGKGVTVNEVRLVAATVLEVYLVVLIARLVFDWIQMFARSWRPSGVVLVVAEGVYTVTDPPLKLVRKVVPPLRLGGFSLDLAFLIVVLTVQVAANLLR